MLAEIEKKIAALLGDAMKSRLNLSFITAPGPPAAEAGKRIAVVSIAEATPNALFHAEQFELQTNPKRLRRVLPVSFITAIDFALRPAPDALEQSRTLLLDDLALSSHFLAGEKIRNGASFVVANPDPGFKVTEFKIGKHVFNRDLQQGLLTARLECLGEAIIWPPGPVEPQGQIDAVDINIIPQPITVLPPQPAVSTGGILRLQVRGLPVRRGPVRTPGTFSVAVRVLSDVPPAQRGVIVNGVQGAESNLRIVSAGSPDTEVQYQAPASGVQNLRVEVVTLFFATPEGKPGAFLGAIPVRVIGGS